MGSNRPILVVDDDHALRDFIRLVLEDAGYEVVEATEGVAALDVMRQFQPRLILLDMRMPGMNGWEFVNALHEAERPIPPIVMMTAGHDPKAKASEIGADRWLAKPFDLDQLVAAVEQLLESPRASA